MALVTVITLLLCSSCITNKDLTLLQDGKKMPQYEQADYSYYRLQKNDMIKIRLLTTNDEAAAIFDMNNGSSSSSSGGNSYRIYEDGTIDIPFINNIPVAGLTLREAAKVIEGRMKEFVPDAMVKVALANDKFYVIADKKTGVYEFYKEKLNIFQALAMTGNIPNNVDRRRVRIIRPDVDGKAQVIQFDMRAKSIIGSEYYYIQPNDVIYISSIKGNFFRTESYTESVGFITTSINFLVTVFNLGVQTGLYKK
ncbi:MAG: polysaccharide biosynthesis/export family protein [Paludibacteraceae bacterium]|nr:polysaccharide biosynthesis/export family protein [Paludibacteraceae bacterium]